MYRLEPGGSSVGGGGAGSEHSAVTNMYSMSTPASRATTPLPQHMLHATEAGGPVPAGMVGSTTHGGMMGGGAMSHDTLHLVNSGMSHSYTLPHSLSHHHSKCCLALIKCLCLRRLMG